MSGDNPATQKLLVYLIIFIIFGVGTDWFYCKYFNMPDSFSDPSWSLALLKGVAAGDLRFIFFIAYNTGLIVLFRKLANVIIPDKKERCTKSDDTP